MVQQITFIGLGVMGEAMCGNLARRGDWPVVAYDLRPEPLARLAAEGVPSTASLEEAAASDFIITCLPGGDHVIDIDIFIGLMGKLEDTRSIGHAMLQISDPADMLLIIGPR